MAPARPGAAWIRRALLLAALATTTAPAALAAQTDRPAPTPILLLGTFHFAYPGQDVHRSEVRVDILSPERQREVADLVDRLAAFRPTRIAVEVAPGRQAALDSTYRAYLAGQHTLTADETQQIGFRLARRLGHARLHAVDAQPGAAFRPIFEQMEANEAALDTVDASWQQRYRAGYAREDTLAARSSLREHLAYLNAPEQLRVSHGGYSVGWFKLEGADGYLGPDFRAAWYSRNLRIFRNLQRLTGDGGERILLIIGAGHLPILNFVASTSPEFEVADTGTYLGAGSR